ncbi:MAG: dihydrolipoyl dehydrogenase [Mailhella sp.]|nr:dihydrolipoyl dehydrogenase [Mailhella sp.]
MSQRITVIGAGPGGYTAAFEAAKLGAEVTLVEAKWLGGTCLNCGCIPAKTFVTTGEAFEAAKRGAEFGVFGIGSDIKVDMPTLVARKHHVSDTLIGGLEKTCAKLKVKLIYGFGKVINANLVQVTKQDGTVEEVAGDKIILANGSNSMNLPNLPIDGKYIMSSDDALELDHVPASAIFVGGGVVGCELAFAYSKFGCKVTIVEGQTRLLPVPSIDMEISKLLQREAKKQGITVECCRTVSNFEIVDGKVRATLAPSPFLKPEQIPAAAQKEAVVDVDCIFVVVGRVANNKENGLAEAGIELDRRGYVVANEYLETSVPGIYAIGDTLGPTKIMLAHVAAVEGKIAARNAMGAHEAMKYGVIPSGIFVSPELADVGLTEEQCKAQGLNYAASTFQFRELGKAQAMGELPGFFKLLVDKDTRKILGAHFAGAHTTDLISEIAVAIENGLTVDQVAGTIHAHPTLAEGVLEAALMF